MIVCPHIPVNILFISFPSSETVSLQWHDHFYNFFLVALSNWFFWVINPFFLYTHTIYIYIYRIQQNGVCVILTPHFHFQTILLITSSKLLVIFLGISIYFTNICLSYSSLLSDLLIEKYQQRLISDFEPSLSYICFKNSVSAKEGQVGVCLQHCLIASVWNTQFIKSISEYCILSYFTI